MSQSIHHEDDTSPETDREYPSRETMPQIPAGCWKRRLDAKLKHKQKPFTVGIKEGVRLFPLGVRLFSHVYHERKSGRDPVLDPFNEIKPNDNQGVAIGGLGSGAITRGWRGEFCRWSLVPGRPRYRTVEADQFSVFIQRPNQTAQAKVLTPRFRSRKLKSWDWSLKGDKSYYNALFPRAWTVYEEPDPKLRLTCQQFSPVIANNYKESSYPVGVFVWNIENLSHTPADVSLMFSFQNGTGGLGDVNGGHLNVPIDTSTSKGKNVVGVEMKNASHKRLALPGRPQHVEDKLSFVIASEVEEGATVTRTTAWNPQGDGSEIWRSFSKTGTLEDINTISNPTLRGQTTASALAVKQHLGPYEKKQVVFVLSWDTPVARFGSGRGQYRRYTRFFGRDGDVAPKIALEALNNWQDWLSQVESWQNVFLQQRDSYPNIPEWYHTALMNELYYLVDGGTIWTDGDAGGGPSYNAQNYHNEANAEIEDPQEIFPSDTEYGHFAYLESHEYIMYNTYDVHFYAGFALIQLWPQIELSLQRDIARCTMTGLREEVVFCGDGRRSSRKALGMTPHDIGSPGGDPWFSPNSYTVQDVNRWKDLNSKLILQIYRDYIATQDKAFLNDMLPVVKTAFQNLKKFDKDGDGMIENEGYPDQTYDAWTVRGISAYCGGLWLACVAATRAILVATNGPEEEITSLTDILAKGKAAYENALWNGHYFNYDNSHSRNSTTIMSDQLAGQWYARACGLEDIAEEEHINEALLTVFNNNVMKLHNGQAGAVNGMRPGGKVDYASMQSSEIWTGTTYGLAASLIQQGLTDEGFRTAFGIYKGTYETYGYWFQTPESWDSKGRYRAPAYMRPLAVWGLQWAIDHVVPKSALETRS